MIGLGGAGLPLHSAAGGIGPFEIKAWTQNDGGSSSSTSVVGNKPSGVAVGNLLLLIVMNDYGGAGPEFIDDVTGWTYINTSGNSGSNAHIGAYWRIADGTEPSTVTVTSANANYWGAYYLCIGGAHATTPINVSNFGLFTFGSSPFSLTGVTTTVDNCLVFYAASVEQADGFPFSIAGPDYTEIDDFQTSTTSSEMAGCIGSRELASAGASGSADLTMNFDRNSAFCQIAIAPA